MNLQDIQRKLNISYPEAKKFKEQAELLGLFSVVCSYTESDMKEAINFAIWNNEHYVSKTKDDVFKDYIESLES